jgi:diketogulonate reductase-like aldo/keto reductase
MSLLDIPNLGIGTYKLKTQEEINHTLKHALSSGYRMIDTATLYKNEELISNYLKMQLADHGLKRNDIWVTTKVPYFSMLDGKVDKIRKGIETSIELFGGYVDLYLIHASNHNDVITWKILREYQTAGKIRNVGISNYNLERLIKFCVDIGNDEVKYIYMNQIEFNPFLNRSQLLELCFKKGIKVTAYGSLYKTNDYIVSLADKYKLSCEQILLKWATQKGIVVIPMSRNSNHIVDNYNSIQGVHGKLNILEEDMKVLNRFDEGFTKFLKHL